MRSASILALAGSASAAIKGFNYGATNTAGVTLVYADFVGEFNSARNLVGTDNTFTSARLYTTIQGNSVSPIEAIQAAIDTNTSLLLGLWASAGQSHITDEITALTAAINAHGATLAGLVQGISVGSEDIYRSSALGQAANAGVGTDPDTIINYIGQVRAAIAGTALSAAPVGHVDTYNTWSNGTYLSNLIAAVDFIGVDAYPYYEGTKANSIDNSMSQFYGDFNAVVAVNQGKPVWVTETGWPIQGPTVNQAVASLANAATYFTETGCSLFSGNINTWWYTLQDDQPVLPATDISFGVVGPGSPPPTTPLYSLAC